MYHLTDLNSLQTKIAVFISEHITFCVSCVCFLQAIFNAQKMSVPGDLISVPGATEKISFSHVHLF